MRKLKNIISHSLVARNGWHYRFAIAILGSISLHAHATDVRTLCQTGDTGGCIDSRAYFEDTAAKPSLTGGAAPQIGLALAGGGTRASQFSVGVLKGLHEAKVLKNVTHLSTVSGGGYAGYWYTSQRLNQADDKDLFADCIPSRYGDVASSLLKGSALATCTQEDVVNERACLCPASPKLQSKINPPNLTNVLRLGEFGAPGTTYLDPYRYQNALRGHTDLFAPKFNYSDTNTDNRFSSSIVLPFVSQLASSLTVDLVGDVLFDWNTNSSPSRFLYREGIKRVYGLPPLDCADYLRKQSSPLDLGHAKDCMHSRPLLDEAQTDQIYKLPTFDDLRRVKFSGQERIPNWIINATTPVLNCPKLNGEEFCVRKEFFSTHPYPAHKATFEFTPDYWGAGEFGYWPVNSNNNPFISGDFDLINAVSSSAAFFDPNEKSVSMGGLINGLLQITGFKWGYYLQNPHVSRAQRVLHRGLFFPLYLAHRWQENKDAVDIHLIDGGQSENLGAYALIRRRIPNIIISDHASEATPGNMEDICKLKRALQLPEFAANNAGKVWHIHFDHLERLEEVCSEKNSYLLPKNERMVYNVWAWKNPIVEGCAVEIPEDQVSSIPLNEQCEGLRSRYSKDDVRSYLRLFLLKPAIDLNHYQGAPYSHLPARTDAELASTTEVLGFIKNNVEYRFESGDMLSKKKFGLLFPTHTTVNLTIDSSPWLFGAYRELAAQASRNLIFGDGSTVKVSSRVRKEIQKPVTVEEMELESKRLTDQMRFAE